MVNLPEYFKKLSSEIELRTVGFDILHVLGYIFSILGMITCIVQA